MSEQDAAFHLIIDTNNIAALEAVLGYGGFNINSRDRHGRTALYKVISRNNTQVLDILLKFGIWPNVSDREEATKGYLLVSNLAHAIECGNTEIITRLINAGANVNYVPCSKKVPKQALGPTPLFHAVKCLRFDVVQQLLDAGADPNQVSKWGDCPLHLACVLCQVSMTRLLLDNGASVNAQNVRGKTPLHCLLQKENNVNEAKNSNNVNNINSNSKPRKANKKLLQMMEVLLLREDIDLTLRDREGNTVFHLSTTPHTLALLIRAAQRQCRAHLGKITPHQNVSHTPISESLLNKTSALSVECLEDAHSDILLSERQRDVAYDEVIKSGPQPVGLVRSGTNDREINGSGDDNMVAGALFQNNSGNSTLFGANGFVKGANLGLLTDHTEISDVSPASGCVSNNPNGSETVVNGVSTNEEGDTESKRLKLLSALKAKYSRMNGVGDLNMKEIADRPALEEEETNMTKCRIDPCTGECLNVRQNLIKSCEGAAVPESALTPPVNIKNVLGQTPLHVIVNRGDSLNFRQMALQLLHNGAQVNCLSKVQRTPLHMALRCSFPNMALVQILLSHGADINARGQGQESPFSYALQNCHDLTILQYLLKHTNISMDTLQAAILSCSQCDHRDPYHYPNFVSVHCDQHMEILTELLQKGVTPNYQDASSSQYPLYVAVTSFCQRKVKMLLEAGADPNLQVSPSLGGSSALHMSVTMLRADCADIPRLLVQHGALLHLVDSQGMNAVDKLLLSLMSTFADDFSAIPSIRAENPRMLEMRMNLLHFLVLCGSVANNLKFDPVWNCVSDLRHGAETLRNAVIKLLINKQEAYLVPFLELFAIAQGRIHFNASSNDDVCFSQNLLFREWHDRRNLHPPSLRELARLGARRYFASHSNGRSIVNLVNNARLPTLIKNYVLLTDMQFPEYVFADTEKRSADFHNWDDVSTLVNTRNWDNWVDNIVSEDNSNEDNVNQSDLMDSSYGCDRVSDWSEEEW